MFADDEEAPTWLFRSVPSDSPEVDDVNANGEIIPPRPDLRGERYRQWHVNGFTDTAYTSWSARRSIAVAAAESAAAASKLRGAAVIFRIRFDQIPSERLFPGREDEDEYLIEGRIDGVELSDGNEEESE